jgi:hypothetical protein
MFNLKSLQSDVKRHYLLFNSILYTDVPWDSRYPEYRTLGLIPYFKTYGFWPVVRYYLWKNKKKEVLSFKYVYIAEPFKKSFGRHVPNSPGHWRHVGIKNPYFLRPGSPASSIYSLHFPGRQMEYANDLVLKILYKKNIKIVTSICDALSKLWQMVDNLYKTKKILYKFDRERTALNMGGKGGNKKTNDSELDELVNVPPLNKQSTGYIRKIVIEELDLLRAGKVSVKRSRIVSSLASRALESMHLDLESQFLYLKEEARNLKALPESLNEKMQP